MGAQFRERGRVSWRQLPDGWLDRAACKGTDPSVFWDTSRQGGALALCESCPVRSECAAEARVSDIPGVVGGVAPPAVREFVGRASPNPSLTADQLEELVRLIDGGLSRRAAGERLGIGKSHATRAYARAKEAARV